jgi:hypothetical protein
MQHACIILADSPGPLVELCGISILERLLRTLQRCGITRVVILSSADEPIAQHLAKPSWARDQLELTIHDRPAGELTPEQIVDLVPDSARFVLILRGDSVFDNRLLPLLLAQTSAAALVDAGQFCGAWLLPRDWILAQRGSFESAITRSAQEGAITLLDVSDIPLYSPAVRREMKPFWFHAPPASQVRKAESLLLDSIQKGSQDLPAYVHAPIERFLVSRLCTTPVRPNQITVVWTIAALAATILFLTGHLLWGIGLALVIGLLDGLDGKLARLKVETTKGGQLEHQVDNVLEVGWPAALAFHFYRTGQLPNAFIYLGVLIVADILDGLGKLGVYSAAEKSLRKPLPVDRIVRLFGGRRNVYVWILIACLAAGVPAKSIVVMAWWESITAMVDLAHAGWAQLGLRRSRRADHASVLL